MECGLVWGGLTCIMESIYTIYIRVSSQVGLFLWLSLYYYYFEQVNIYVLIKIEKYRMLPNTQQYTTDKIIGQLETNLNNNLIVNSTTISPTILSYLSGTTSNIQNQISSINTSVLLGLNNTWTGTNIFSNTVSLNNNLIVNSTTISPTVLSYLSGVTSNIQNQIS